MEKIKVMSIFGTRPEAIKLAPLIYKLKKSDQFRSITVSTGQHREMLDQVLNIFNIVPDYNLKIMRDNQTLNDITISILRELTSILKLENPNIILVHGDTTTTFSASLSAFYQKISIAHVESGLRTWSKYSPYPEEMNRQLTDVLSDYYFAPTVNCKKNLLKENHSDKNIFVTGNTAIDTLKFTIDKFYGNWFLKDVDPNKKIILITLHRRENIGRIMKDIFKAIIFVARLYPNVQFVYPVHLNPIIQKDAYHILGNYHNIYLIKPIDIIKFHNLMLHSYFILTDSGGIQEEASYLHRPVLVLRNSTERSEGIENGTLKLIGTNYENIKNSIINLLNNKQEYQKMSNSKNPYGDGYASDRIIQALLYIFHKIKFKPKDFLY